MKRTKIGKWVDEQERLGTPKKATAKKLGISYVHLFRLSRGDNKPSKALAKKIQRLTGIDWYRFL